MLLVHVTFVIVSGKKLLHQRPVAAFYSMEGKRLHLLFFYI